MPRSKAHGGFRGLVNAAYEERFGFRFLGRVLEGALEGLGVVSKRSEGESSHDPETERVQQETFRLFDRNNDGFISVQELQLVLKALRMKEDLEKCQKMVNDADADGDGKLNYEEFKRLTRQMRN